MTVQIIVVFIHLLIYIICICFCMYFDSIGWAVWRTSLAHTSVSSIWSVSVISAQHPCVPDTHTQTMLCVTGVAKDRIYTLWECSPKTECVRVLVQFYALCSFLVKSSERRTISLVLRPIHETGKWHWLKQHGSWTSWPRHCQNSKKQIQPISTHRPQMNRLSFRMLVDNILSNGYLYSGRKLGVTLLLVESFDMVSVFINSCVQCLGYYYTMCLEFVFFRSSLLSDDTLSHFCLYCVGVRSVPHSYAL